MKYSYNWLFKTYSNIFEPPVRTLTGLKFVITMQFSFFWIHFHFFHKRGKYFFVYRAVYYTSQWKTTTAQGAMVAQILTLWRIIEGVYANHLPAIITSIEIFLCMKTALWWFQENQSYTSIRDAQCKQRLIIFNSPVPAFNLLYYCRFGLNSQQN